MEYERETALSSLTRPSAFLLQFPGKLLTSASLHACLELRSVETGSALGYFGLAERDPPSP